MSDKKTLLKSLVIFGSLFLMLNTATVSAIYIPPPGGGMTYTVVGHVENSNGDDISNALVKLYKNSEIYVKGVYTDSNGYFSISTYQLLTPDWWQVRVTKSGYDELRETKQVGVPTTNFGDLELTQTPPPVEYPEIGIPSYTRDTAYEVTFTVGVSWNYDPYLSRDVWLMVGPDVDHLTQYAMNPIGDVFSKTIFLDAYTANTYKIKATETWEIGGYPPIQNDVTSYSDYYDVSDISDIFEEIYSADCSSTTGWNQIYYNDQNYLWPYPFPSGPWHNQGYLQADSGYFITNLDKGNGPIFRYDLPDFSLEELGLLKIDLARDSVIPKEMGFCSIVFYDNNRYPIFYVIIDDNDPSEMNAVLEFGYFSSNLEKSSLIIDDTIETTWSGSIRIWFEIGRGLRIDYDEFTHDPLCLFSWSGSNPGQEISSVVMQWSEYLGAIEEVFKVEGITIEKYPEGYPEFVNIAKATELRSGPKNFPVDRPGPTNEIQMFPEDGTPLEFQFAIPELSDALYLWLDIRPISYSGSTDSSELTIDIKMGGVDNYRIVPLSMTPYISASTMNFLHEAWIEPNALDFVIQLSVSGPDWDANDIVAFRGIWVEQVTWIETEFVCNLVTPVKQMFVSDELTYLVPMGPDTEIDLEWGGADYLYIDVVDDVSEPIPSGVYIDIPLGDFSRTYNELKLISDSGAYVEVMHTTHDWVTVEIDYINYPAEYIDHNGRTRHFPADIEDGIWNTFEEYLVDLWDKISLYYNDFTHGKLKYVIDDTIAYDEEKETTGYTADDIVAIGNLEFNARGERDYIWFFYGDHLVGNDGGDVGGWAIHNDDLYNGWNRWMGGCLNWSWNRGGSYHELGHVAHVHEGYPDKPEWGEPCECEGCVMGQKSDELCYCMFHWYQTWNSVIGCTMMPNWATLWWLL